MMDKKFHGIMPPILSPMDEEGCIDEVALRRYVNFLIEEGVNVLIVNGTMGEFYALTEEERNRNLEVVIDEVDGRLPVIAGTGHSGTIPAIRLSKTAEKLGASAVQVMPPYYIVPTDDGIYAHYKDISDAIGIPVFIYNNVGTTKIELSGDMITRLSEIDNVIGCKLSPGGRVAPVELARNVREKTNDEFIILIATASLWFYGLELGISNGCVMGLPNVFPHEYAKMYSLLREGKVEEARKIHKSFLELDHLCTTELGGRPRYQYMYKTMLMWRGIIPSNTVRKPMMPCEEYRLKLLSNALKAMNFEWYK